MKSELDTVRDKINLLRAKKREQVIGGDPKQIAAINSELVKQAEKLHELLGLMKQLDANRGVSANAAEAERQSNLNRIR